MALSQRSHRRSRGRLYSIALAVVVVAVLTSAGSALYITTGGSLFGMGAGTFGVAHERPDETAATLQRAREAAWAGRHDQALAAYDTAMDRRPTDREVALERARVLAWAEQYFAAADALADVPVEPRDTSAVDIQIQRARFLWWSGRPRDADSLLSVVRAAYPDVAEAAELQALVRPSVEPAVDVATRWVGERPDDPRANLWLARALVGEGRGPEAIAPYRRALGEPGTLEPEVLLEAAGVALGADSLSFAGQLLSRYLRDVDPPDHDTRLRLARAYSWSGRYAAAAEQYRIVLAQAPAAGVRRELAEALARAGRYDDAAAELVTLLAARPSPDLLRELARVRALAERYDGAADALGLLLDARPDDHAARLDRARYLWWSGRLEAADDELTRLLAAVPEHDDARALRAEVRPGIEPSIERARAWLAEEESAANRLHLARALVKADRHADALEHYDAALGDAADRELAVEAADVADAARMPGRVVDILARHAAAVDRPEPAMRLRLARALAWVGRHEAAAGAFAGYLADRPGDVEARLDRARELVSADTAFHGEARSELERVVAAEPDRADAHRLLGDLARWAGDPDAALEHYRRAEAVDPAAEHVDEGIRLALELRHDLRQAQIALRDATQVAWALELDAFTDTEGFDWVGSGVRREWRFGANALSALSLRLGHGYSRGHPLDGAGLGATGMGAVLGGRLALAHGLTALAELGAMAYGDVDTFATWGAGLEYATDPALVRLRYGRTPAVREAATMAALQAAAVMDRLHLEGQRDMGPWHAATDLQLQRFRADAGDADRYAAMVRLDRAVGETGVAVGGLVRGIFATDRAPALPGWGRLYWTPDHYIAPALSVRYGANIADGLWLGLRASPGIAFIDEGDGGMTRYDTDRTAILEAGATLGYRVGPWRLDLSGDWGGALPDGYNASSLRFQISRFGGPR
jgi:tetratricopeptide (TPR) repeat protein